MCARSRDAFTRPPPATISGGKKKKIAKRSSTCPEAIRLFPVFRCSWWTCAFRLLKKTNFDPEGGRENVFVVPSLSFAHFSTRSRDDNFIVRSAIVVYILCVRYSREKKITRIMYYKILTTRVRGLDKDGRTCGKTIIFRSTDRVLFCAFTSRCNVSAPIGTYALFLIFIIRNYRCNHHYDHHCCFVVLKFSLRLVCQLDNLITINVCIRSPFVMTKTPLVAKYRYRVRFNDAGTRRLVPDG